MAKRRKVQQPDPGHDVSAEPLAAHEGERPDPADREAYARWRRTRAARWHREIGTAGDPRLLLDTRARVKGR